MSVPASATKPVEDPTKPPKVKRKIVLAKHGERWRTEIGTVREYGRRWVYVDSVETLRYAFLYVTFELVRVTLEDVPGLRARRPRRLLWLLHGPELLCRPWK
jgi:hypothetical protein